MHKLFLFVSLFLVSLCRAAEVDTITVSSKFLGQGSKTVVVKPVSTDRNKSLPVLYLLHGYGGNYTDWVKKVPHLQQLADQHGMFIICPDGGTGSWYFDSPVDSTYRYESYITKELIPYVDQHYSTKADRAHRAITGLSMGGHGALYLSFRHPELFGAAGSMSGGVDFRPFPGNWDIAKRLGSYRDFPERWESNTVINLIHLLQPGELRLIVDCGTEDFFYGVNEAFHRKLAERNIKHDYITRPGVHNWDYWQNAIVYQMLFMHQFFEAAGD